MQTRLLGCTGRHVSALGFGLGGIAAEGRPSEAEGVRVVLSALDAGMTWLSTADSHCLDATETGYGERIAARALREGKRDDVLVSTKGGVRRDGGEWTIDARPRRLREACEASLAALGVSSLFLYSLECPDPRVYFPDSIGALADLKREGKIRHIGLANVDVGHIREATAIVEIAAVENRASLFEPVCFENDVVRECERKGIAFVAHGEVDPARATSIPAVATVAARRGAKPHQVATAWLLARSPTLLVSASTRDTSLVTDTAAAADVLLTEYDLKELDTAAPTHPFMTRQIDAAKREARFFLRSARATVKRRIEQIVRG
jgi:aryl-alcohol dehydrogenase-like predicted oxidoreductase